MGQPQILDKLGVLLSRPISEESQVVYLMVETRKLLALEKARQAKYPWIKFYADWSVHSSKDTLTPEITNVSDDIFKAAVEHIENRYPKGGRSPIEAFAHLDTLRSELLALLREWKLPEDIVDTNETWLLLSNCLIKVLEEQPINFKKGPIKSIEYVPSAPKSVLLKVVFSQPVRGEPSYNYGNVLY